MTKQFIEFFIERAKFSPGKSWLDLVEQFGKICDPQFKEEGPSDLISCANNPLVFIDMLKLDDGSKVDINFGFWVLMQKYNEGKNILYSAPEDTGKTKFILGFVLYKILFSKEHVHLSTGDLDKSKDIILQFYRNLPEYLKIKPESALFSNPKSLEDTDLIIYDSISLGTSKVPISKNIRTIIICKNSESEDYRKWLVDNRDVPGKYRYTGINFTFKDLGLGEDYFNKIFNKVMLGRPLYGQAKLLYDKLF